MLWEHVGKIPADSVLGQGRFPTEMTFEQNSDGVVVRKMQQ